MWPRLSAVSEGSCRVIEIGELVDFDCGDAGPGILKVRDAEGIAVSRRK